MKTKFYLPVMILFLLGFSSCSIDDDNGDIDSVEAHLIGKWDLEGYTVNDNFMAAEGDILEFKVGGVMVGHSDDGEVAGNYTISGNQLALNFPEGGDIFTIQTLNITTLLLYNEEEFDHVEGVDEVLYHFKKLPN
jgi:hypothetical protein